MAGLVDRENGSWAVVYSYKNEKGEKKQKWETFHDFKSAKARKAEVEYEQNNNKFIAPRDETLKDYLSGDYLNLYAKDKWGHSVWSSNMSLMNNYIFPIIGDVKLQAFDTLMIDRYIDKLRKTHPVSTRTHKAKTEYLTEHTIDKIIRLLHCAFNQARIWNRIPSNPVDNCHAPKIKYKERDIWTLDEFKSALDWAKENDYRMYIILNLAFCASLRAGEVCGLTWENVHITDSDILSDAPYIEIVQIMERVSKDALENIRNPEDKPIIYKVFPPLQPNTSTRLVLKKPKTDESIRKVFIPKSVAYVLRDWAKRQEEVKSILGKEYQDNDLVVPRNDGLPFEVRQLEKFFSDLIKATGLPKVVFHSVRHSSITEKAHMTNDPKNVAADAGHSSSSKLTEDVYRHAQDEKRKKNAMMLEEQFYSDNVTVEEPPLDTSPAPVADASAIFQQLQQSPELLASLRQMLLGNTGASAS